jgi:hypothetical protein
VNGLRNQAPVWVPTHADKIIRRLERDIFPWLGASPITSITAQQLLIVARRIEERGVKETARRALLNCSQVFRYAIATGRAERDPVPDLKGALQPAKTTHFATMTDPKAIAELLRAIDTYHGSFVTKCALQLAPLVFVRHCIKMTHQKINYYLKEQYMITSNCRRWLLWKFEPQENSKPKKVPYYASGKKRNGKLDSPEDIAQLVSFDEVQMVLSQGGYTGLGFALGADNNGGFWQGIDFDGIDNKPELQRLITSLPGYVETSPSKNGVHAIGYGRHFNPIGSNQSGIEAYCSGRFFTVIGDNAFYMISDDIEDLADFVEEILKPLRNRKNDAVPLS